MDENADRLVIEPITTPKVDRDLLGASILCTAEVAVGVISNKYAAQLQWWGLLLICAIPLALSIVWIVRRERVQGKLQNLWRSHPLSYSIIAIIAIVFFCNSISMLIAKMKVPAPKNQIASQLPPVTPM